MNDNYLGQYFKKEERKARRLHREVDPSSWPEYVTATQARVRRVVTDQRATPRVNKVASNVENLYMDQTAQDIAHSQVSRSRRGRLPRKITPVTVLTWGSWGIAMLTFASSLLLNFPFGVGAFVLKVVPGEPRTGEIVLTQTNAQSLHPGDLTEVRVSLNGLLGKNVQEATTTLSYDQGALELQEVSTESSSFSKPLDTHYDASSGKVFLSLEGQKDSGETSPELATISFKVKAFVGTTQLHVIPETYITLQGQKASIPQTLSSLNLSVGQKEIASVSVPLPSKKDSVTIDGSLSDWRDVIAYNPASFKPSGTPITYANLKEGRVTSATDFSGVLQLAETSDAVYLAFSATDDEVLDGDKVAIKFDSQVFEVPIHQALTQTYTGGGVESKAVGLSGGYVLEVKIPMATLQNKSGRQPFNFEVHDVDSQDSADLILSYPSDSHTKP